MLKWYGPRTDRHEDSSLDVCIRYCENDVVSSHVDLGCAYGNKWLKWSGNKIHWR